MEITESMVYWITRLDSIKGCIAPIFYGGVIAIPFFMFMIVGPVLEGEIEDVKKAMKKYLPIWIIFFVISLTWPFIPTTKEMCAILIIPQVAKNEDMKEIPGEITKLAREWIEELSPKKEEKE